MRDKTLNMTEGSPVRLLIMFSVPMLIGNIFQQLYNIVDSIIVGKLIGADALAAIGVTGSVTFLFFALCNGFGSAGGIITSQNFGKQDAAQVKRCIANTGYIMIVFPAILGIAAFCGSRLLLTILGTPEKIFSESLRYMQIMCLGLVFVSLYNYVSSILRALGDSKTPLYFLIFSCLLNTVLDVVFVKYLGYGVAGAGIATLISQFISGAGCMIYAFRYNPYFKLERKDWAVDSILIIKTIKLGVPLSLQFSLIAISCMALQKVVNSFGPVAVAAFTAISRVEQVIHQPYQTLSAALSTFSGQNYGARKYERITLGFKKSMLIMVIFTIMMLPIMQFFGSEITSIFVNEPDVIAMGAIALKITSPFYVFLGIIYVVRGALNGVGDAFFALLNGIIEVIGRFVFPIFLTMIPAIGLWGIWWSVGGVWFISALTAWLRYEYKKKQLLTSIM